MNKGTSCQILLDQLDIRYAECAGLGNDYNDIDFLERCGYPYIVANAPEPLRVKFNNVTNDTDSGLAEFIHMALNL